MAVPAMPPFTEQIVQACKLFGLGVHSTRMLMRTQNTEHQGGGEGECLRPVWSRTTAYGCLAGLGRRVEQGLRLRYAHKCGERGRRCASYLLRQKVISEEDG